MCILTRWRITQTRALYLAHTHARAFYHMGGEELARARAFTQHCTYQAQCILLLLVLQGLLRYAMFIALTNMTILAQAVIHVIMPVVIHVIMPVFYNHLGACAR